MSVAPATRLWFVKLFHTVIWLILVLAILYVFYSGLTDTVNPYTWWAIGLVLAELLVLLYYKWSCPLTLVARRYSDSQAHNFDIFLPEWLAQHNKHIFGVLFAMGLLLVGYRVLW